MLSELGNDDHPLSRLENPPHTTQSARFTAALVGQAGPT
jgi:hypothetical protein